ncbi:protein GRINL1A [Electrophorus electricus]|uniref:RNA polymerase II subunit M n=1 Tax=Electrophorus electricus TaxID=8005 RepID=A0A4W4GM42_ELEEL|nr:protein GRINL1A [Electrophorus electricus]
MSTAWTERHGEVGDLSSKSKEDLLEILSRQEKILHNKRFINTLPDKGKKISDFAERVRLALANLKEEEKKQASLSSVRTEFQAKYQHAFAQSHITLVSSDSDTARLNLKDDEDSLESGNINTYLARSSGRVDEPQATETPEKRTEPTAASNGELVVLLNNDTSKDADLVNAFERVTLSEGKSAPSEATLKNTSPKNPFSHSQFHKKPHYIDILEKSDASVRKPRFKPNQLLVKSTSPSPGQSPGSVTPLTAEARRQRDRKHLDDITAARFPPMHHSPAQLLSLEESFGLLQEQAKMHQELQARLAAQKLAEGLTVGMSTYNPEGGALAAYREVHDDGALSEEN